MLTLSVTEAVMPNFESCDTPCHAQYTREHLVPMYCLASKKDADNMYCELVDNFISAHHLNDE